MIVERFIVGGGDNYNYLIISEKTKSAIAIDPLATDRLLAFADKHGVVIIGILITHGHLDHTDGANTLREKTGAKIFGHSEINIVTQSIEDNERFACEGISILPLNTPGHTYDSMCYLIDDMLFTGDTVFFSGAGNCMSGDAESLYDSFAFKINTLPGATKLYVGHEYAVRNLEFARSIEPENKLIQEWLLCARKKQLPISTLAEERIYNPFFRFNDENFRTALEIKLNHIFNDPKEIFLITRSLRDAW